MRSNRSMLAVAAFVLGLVVPVPVWAFAQPPNRINYQGVLRDQNGNPLTGTYDMLFRFMDAETAGNEIMFEPHTVGTSNAVPVSAGLFNVVLGSGTLIDGSGPGTYTSFIHLFRDQANIWLEVQVGAETLSPRTKLHSVPFALNATYLDGKWPGEFIDTTTLQSKSAGLLVTESFWFVPALEGVSVMSIGVRGSGPEVGVEGVSTGGFGGTFASDTGTGLRASTSSSTAGAAWFSSPNSSVRLDYGNYGVYAEAPATGGIGVYGKGGIGGHFERAPGLLPNATLAANDLGISASGRFLGAYFSNDSPYSSYAEIPWYDAGMRAHGSISGGSFDNFATSAWGLVGYSSYKILGNGAVSFAQNHPDDPTKVIVYAAPEGDEVAVYTRGSGRLVDGEARVALGKTFALVTNPDIGLTATATPRGEPVPLAVFEVSPSELVVRGPAGSDAEFDYMVWGLRIGFEEQSIVQPKQNDAKIPSMHDHEQVFSDEPELRRYTALARFQDIGATLHRKRPLDFSRAERLRDAVGVFAHRPSSAEPSGGRPGVPGASDGPADAGPAAAPALPSAGTGFEPAASTLEARAIDEPQTVSLDGLAQSDIMTAAEMIEPGDVVSLDPDRPVAVVRSTDAGDPLVIGCARDVGAGALPDGQVAIATRHVALCRVDAAYGMIAVGDRLVASPIPGVAMKADPSSANGAVLGRAVESLEAGSALIRVLVGAR